MLTRGDLTAILPIQALYLMPSSSARCAQFPRAQDKVHFYIKLKELKDQLKGVQKSTEVQEVEYSFDLKLAKGKLDHGSLSVFKEQKMSFLKCDVTVSVYHFK